MGANGIVPATRKFWLLLALGLVLNPVTVGIVFWNTVCPGFSKGPSMHPTIPTPGLDFLDRLTYRVRDPKRGEIIAVVSSWDDNYVLSKRVIGLPGEVVEVDEGTVYINGEPLAEPYLKIPYDSDGEYTYQQLGPDQYWVMGDNRGNSLDSRDFGPIQRASIRGREVGIYWPLSSATPAGLLFALLWWGTVLGCAAGFGIACRRAGQERGLGGSVAVWGILFWAFGYWIVWRRSNRTLPVTDTEPAAGAEPAASASVLTYIAYGAFQLWVSVGVVSLLVTPFYPDAWRTTAVATAVVNVVFSVIAFRRRRLGELWGSIAIVGIVSVIFGGATLVVTDNSIACAFGAAAGAGLAHRGRQRAKQRFAAANQRLAAAALAAVGEESQAEPRPRT
jgi:signal peptidase I